MTVFSNCATLFICGFNNTCTYEHALPVPQSRSNSTQGNVILYFIRSTAKSSNCSNRYNYCIYAIQIPWHFDGFMHVTQRHFRFRKSCIHLEGATGQHRKQNHLKGRVYYVCQMLHKAYVDATSDCMHCCLCTRCLN